MQAHLGDVDRIDRDTVWAAKRAALQLVHDVPRSGGREAAYRAYCAGRVTGWTTSRPGVRSPRCTGRTGGTGRPTWRTRARPRSTAFRAAIADRVDFHRWLQWVLDEQLAGTQAAAVRAGMVLGVMHDLAVGVHPNGADCWLLQDVFAQGITVGAPPDTFNQAGQDWTQPPWRPDRLAELAYRPFRDMVSTVLRHSGGIRVDHIIGLFRLWWIPAGHGPAAGTYVRYDHEAHDRHPRPGGEPRSCRGRR